MKLRYAFLLTVASACLVVGAAQAAKPQVKVEQGVGRWLEVTFTAPATTTRDYKYFVRFETARQEGCSWKSTSLARLALAGQRVLVNVSPNSRQGREWCVGAGRVTVFMQRAFGGFVAKDATPATFRLVGRVGYTVG
jgi:hypothetical protein